MGFWCGFFFFFVGQIREKVGELQDLVDSKKQEVAKVKAERDAKDVSSHSQNQQWSLRSVNVERSSFFLISFFCSHESQNAFDKQSCLVFFFLFSSTVGNCGNEEGSCQ
jgi:hypothetical protein